MYFNRFGLFTFVIWFCFGTDIKILTDSKVVNALTRFSISGPLEAFSDIMNWPYTLE